MKLIGCENPKIIRDIDDAKATLVYGIEIDQIKIHIVINISIEILRLFLKFLIPKKGHKTKGEKECIETIIDFGPIKLR